MAPPGWAYHSPVDHQAYTGGPPMDNSVTRSASDVEGLSSSTVTDSRFMNCNLEPVSPNNDDADDTALSRGQGVHGNVQWGNQTRTSMNGPFQQQRFSGSSTYPGQQGNSLQPFQANQQPWSPGMRAIPHGQHFQSYQGHSYPVGAQPPHEVTAAPQTYTGHAQSSSHSIRYHKPLNATTYDTGYFDTETQKWVAHQRVEGGPAPIQFSNGMVSQSRSRVWTAPVHPNRNLHKSFMIQQEGFFVPGKVFRMLWIEPSGSTRSGANATRYSNTTYADGGFYSKIRFFVVVWPKSPHFCQCVSIATYRGQGCNKSGVVKSDHAVIYTGDEVPALLQGEDTHLEDEQPMGTPIKVVKTRTSDPSLKAQSRINYGRIDSIHYNVAVSDYGQIPPDHSGNFFAKWKEVTIRQSNEYEQQHALVSSPSRIAMDLLGTGASQLEPDEEYVTPDQMFQGLSLDDEAPDRLAADQSGARATASKGRRKRWPKRK